MSENEYWEAVAGRDQGYDGRFVFAVRSTGIYCRPSCPARRPKREHVTFFTRAVDAEQAGYRACRRCRPERATQDEPRLELIERICRYLAEPHEQTPTLDELSLRFHLSPYHLHRTFRRLVGVTPRQYAAERRMQHFRAELKTGKTVTDALYEAGYQSSSGLYGEASAQFGMTPTQYRRGGQRMSIAYTLASCPLGWLLVAATAKGICAVRLGNSREELEAELCREFPAAQIQQNDPNLAHLVGALLDYLSGTQPHLDLSLDVQATAFQRRVWQALRAIPYGATRSYGDVARTIGQPQAVRAVAQACAKNPAALVIPCHRVVRQDGGLGGYRWGLGRKRALLEQEARLASITEPELPQPTSPESTARNPQEPTSQN